MMGRTLVIVPTKDRPECINIFVQNLINQPGEFDLFIADMSTDPNLPRNNWLLGAGLRRLQHAGHNWLVARTDGWNQLFGYKKGLQHACDGRYEFAIASDDDCVFEPGWIERLHETIDKTKDAAAIAGITLLPWMSVEEQKCPDWFLDDEDYAGKLDQGDYYHATLVPPWKDLRAYEQLFGPFIFRVQDFVDVGGFPTFLSRLGFRGEMHPMTACLFNGAKLYIDPLALCWHYSASYGGLKLVTGDDREKCLKLDTIEWDMLVASREPSVKQRKVD